MVDTFDNISKDKSFFAVVHKIGLKTISID